MSLIDTNISVQDLAEIFISRYKEPESIPQEHYDYQQYENKNRLNLSSVSEKMQMEAVARIFTNAFKPLAGIMNLETARGLKVLDNFHHSEKKILADEIDRTTTKIGRFYFHFCIANPSNNFDVISKRQSAAKALCDSLIRRELESSFQKLKAYEEHILGFFAEYPPPVTGRFRHLRFTAGADNLNYQVNQYSAAVTASAIYKTVELGLAAGLKAISVAALPLYAISLTGLMGERPLHFLEDFASRTMILSGMVNGIVHVLGNPLIRGAAAVATVALNISSVKSALMYVRADLNIESYVQNKLVVVAHYVRSMEKIYNLLSSHANIIQYLEHFSKLEKFIHTSDPDLKCLISLLKSSTFDAKARLFFARGPLVIVWEKFLNEKVKRLFEEAFLAIGELDTLLSVARLVKESDQFCFPTYLRESTPFIQVKGLHNPTISYDAGAERDSLVLGHKYPQNILLTAPNGRGKSTKLLALSYLAVLQGLGIAPAVKATFSVFDRVITSRGIVDNSEQSRHQVYLNFSDRLIKFFDANPEKKVLVVLDEAFTTTQSMDGVCALGGLLRRLQSTKNAMLIVASHFKELVNRLENFNYYTIPKKGSRKLIKARL